jgi:hypothetical protein
MGSIIQATFDEIVPGEEDFIDSALKNMLNAIISQIPLLPVPVKQLETGKYVHLDGRHRLIGFYLAGAESLDLFLAEDRFDHMDKSMFPEFETYKLSETSSYITKRWDSAETDSLKLDFNNYHEHMVELQSRYDFLHDLESCLEFFGVR